MTYLQTKRLYWPAWARVVRAHGWRMKLSRMPAAPRPDWGIGVAAEQYHQVIVAAQQRALDHARSITPDDLRHACHQVALGRDRSSRDFSNAELDRVLALFRLLADDADLSAVVELSHPEVSAQRRVEFAFGRYFPGYVAFLCHARFGTRDWRAISAAQQRDLLRLLRLRKNALRRSISPAAVASQSPILDPANAPF